MEIIAHRGYSAIAPENTLAAFAAAVEVGAAGVEFDLRLSADGVPVALHDPTLERTTGGRGEVADIALAQLQQLDAGSWFDPKFAGERIPTLAQVVELLAPSPLRLLPEVKSGPDWSEAAIATLLDIVEPVRERCSIAAFDFGLLQQLRDRAEWVALGHNVAAAEEFPVALESARQLGNSAIMCAWDVLLAAPQLAEVAIAAEIEVIAWTVDEADLAERLGKLGIRRLISNTLLR